MPHAQSPTNVRLGLPSLVAIVVTGMIGVGVFTTTGLALEDVPSPHAVMAAWAVAGGIALCGAHAYGALVVRIPESGGEYLYLSRAVHPFAGFLAGVVSLFAGFGAGMALTALSCEQYLATSVDAGPWHGVATGIILLCGVGHAVAAREATRAGTIVVAIKVIAIAALLIAGRALFIRPMATDSPASSLPSVTGFASIVTWIMYSYVGFNQAVYVAGDAEAPSRDVPRALLGGTAITTVLYLLLNDLFLDAAPIGILAGREDVAAVAARAIGGTVFESWMRAAIALTTFSSVAGMMMAGPRVAAAMAADGVLPSCFSGPAGARLAVVLQAGIALILVHQTTIRELLGFLGVTLSLFSALTVATLWWSGGSTPIGRVTRITSIIYVVATIICVAMTIVLDPRNLLGFVITIVTGTTVWLALRWTNAGYRR